MHVLDTNTLIYFFRGQGRVAERLLATRPSQIAIPAPVIYELEVGIRKSTSSAKRQEQLERLVERIRLLPLTLPEARMAGQIRAELEAKGTPIGPLDSLIAGIAVHHGGTLVTHNLEEFRRVEQLSVEDWF